MQTVQLPNGHAMPVIGLGCNTFGKVDRDYHGDLSGETHELHTAIEVGYRHLDTAIVYRNESVIGQAVQESGLDRSDFFLVSKLPGRAGYIESEAAVRQGLRSSLEALRTDYIDLYLIHKPWQDRAQMVQVWQVLEACVDEGLIREIGVSNFQPEDLEAILAQGRYQPAVNQIASHPGEWNHDLVKSCQDLGIYPVAWSPLACEPEAQQVLSEIGAPYGKSWAQVILNYQVNRGVLVIPKSHNPQRQQENLEVLDFDLSPEDIARIETL